METNEAIRQRASVRSYGGAKVSDSEIRELLELATQAPSAGNTQEWIFIVVRDQNTRMKLSEAYAIGRKWQFDAPVVIVVCADMDAIEKAYGERGVSLYAAQDNAAAVENLMLAATNRGFSTCWIGAFNEQLVKNALAIPGNVRPMTMVTLGYAKDRPRKPERKPLSEVAFSELYGKPFK